MKALITEVTEAQLQRIASIEKAMNYPSGQIERVIKKKWGITQKHQLNLEQADELITLMVIGIQIKFREAR